MYNGSIKELFKVLDQMANYQYNIVKVVGKACNMRGKGKEGRQSVRSFSAVENRFLSTRLLNKHHIILIILCTDSNIFGFTKSTQIR